MILHFGAFYGIQAVQNFLEKGIIFSLLRLLQKARGNKR
jgi:hypothetical protein